LSVVLLVVASASCGDDDDDHFDDGLFSGESAPECWRLGLTSFLCWIVTSFAVAAGIGGGGLLVPLYALVLDLGTKAAVPVSKATIFGVACGNVLFIGREKHPQADRPLIDYATVVLMQPGELLGVIFGVLLNRLLPEIGIVIILIVVLGFNAYKTLNKARDRWKKETEANLKTRSDSRRLQDVQETSATTESAPHGSEVQATKDSALPVSPPASPPAAGGTTRLEDVLRAESAQFPVWAWASLLCMTAFLVVYSFLIGGVIIEDLDLCSPAYWPVYVTPIFAYGAIMAVMGRRNIRRHEEKAALGFHFMDGDLQWTAKVVSQLVPAAVLAGVAAGLLGIGGGMILGPLFVSLNFHPKVGTASTGFMILFTALAGTVQYLAVGKLPWRMFLWFGTIGAIGGQTGQRVVKLAVERTGRPSILVFILGTIIALAVIIMASSGIANAVIDAQDGEDVWEVDTSPFVCDDDDRR